MTKHDAPIKKKVYINHSNFAGYSGVIVHKSAGLRKGVLCGSTSLFDMRTTNTRKLVTCLKCKRSM